MKCFREFFFGQPKSLLHAPLVGNIVRYSANDRRGYTLGSKRIVILPNSAFSGFRENDHQTFDEAVFLDGFEGFIKLSARLWEKKSPHRLLQQLLLGIPKEFGRQLVYG